MKYSHVNGNQVERIGENSGYEYGTCSITGLHVLQNGGRCVGSGRRFTEIILVSTMIVQLDARIQRLWLSSCRVIHRINHYSCHGCHKKCVRWRLYTIDCRHTYCKSCLCDLLKDCARSKVPKAPKCCSIPITMDRRRKRLLSARERLQLVNMMRQLTTFPCPNAKCSKLIPYKPDNTFDPCPACHSIICPACHQGWHAGRCDESSAVQKPDATKEAQDDAETDEPLSKMYALQLGWRVCQECQNVADRIPGSSRMKCKCGSDFCSHCGTSRIPCNCRNRRRGMPPQKKSVLEQYFGKNRVSQYFGDEWEEPPQDMLANLRAIIAETENIRQGSIYSNFPCIEDPNPRGVEKLETPQAGLIQGCSSGGTIQLPVLETKIPLLQTSLFEELGMA